MDGIIYLTLEQAEVIHRKTITIAVAVLMSHWILEN